MPSRTAGGSRQQRLLLLLLLKNRYMSLHLLLSLLLHCMPTALYNQVLFLLLVLSQYSYLFSVYIPDCCFRPRTMNGNFLLRLYCCYHMLVFFLYHYHLCYILLQMST